MAGFLLVLINHDTDDNTSNAAENSKKKEKECFYPTHRTRFRISLIKSILFKVRIKITCTSWLKFIHLVKIFINKKLHVNHKSTVITITAVINSRCIFNWKISFIFTAEMFILYMALKELRNIQGPLVGCIFFRIKRNHI